MKTAHLHDMWSSPDNTRLVSKQFSFRLPVHIAAKLAALGEIYPHKNRTQIVADLLSAALDNLEESLPQKKGPEIDDLHAHDMRWLAEQDGVKYEPLYIVEGPRAIFRNTANRHYKQLEKELGNEAPKNLYDDLWLTEAEFRK